jgi:type IV secretory pathway VirJ component
MIYIRPRILILVLALVISRSAAGQNAQPLYTADVRDLPLEERTTRASTSGVFAILLTGDGGFAALDKGVSAELVAHGIPVVVLDIRSYLSRRRTPDSSGSDMIRIMRHYLSAWSMQRVAIVGYSRGADVAPFMISRLPPDLRARVTLVAMLGLAPRVNFQFHFKDIFIQSRRPSDVPTLPELEKLRGMNLLCVYGADEKDSGCRDAPPGLTKEVVRNGGHHFDDDYKALGNIVVDALSKA